MMKREIDMRPTKYIAKFECVNGKITDPIDLKVYDLLRRRARELGMKITRRYNGPRVGDGRNRNLCQSMCRAKNGKEVRVYFY